MLLLVLPALLLACKSKKKSMQGDDPIDIVDFIDFYPEQALPVRVADTSLSARLNDSIRIAHKIFSQFIPDSVIEKDFGVGANPKFYPIGKAREKNKEYYLLTRAVLGSKRVGYLSCFDKDLHYITTMKLLQNGVQRYDTYYAMLDNRFQITVYHDKKVSGTTQFKRNVYILNTAVPDFTLIMTEPNEEMIKEVINPIDTLSRKQKYTADYVQDKKNFISFRDSRKNGSLMFFVHFEKEKGTCVGELKGTARMVTKNKAVYTAAGNPCSIEFVFGTNSVTMTETGGCGSYRNIKCFFEGKYPRKAVPKAKPVSRKP